VYAHCTDSPISKVNADFAARFAAYYLGIEMALKVLSSVVYMLTNTWGPYAIASIYAVIAFGAAMSSTHLIDLDDVAHDSYAATGL
jgi:hypothetical protein